MFNKHLLIAYNVGLFLGCIAVKLMASITDFGEALTVIIKYNDKYYGTEDEIFEEKKKLYSLIVCQYNFHRWSAFLIIVTFILSAIIIWMKFNEVDHGGRFYASQVYKDGL